jgi:hypothetical protein
MPRLMRFLALAVFCLGCSPASARIPSISGWSYSQSEKGIVMSTPCGGGTDIVAYGIYPAYQSNADSREKWFEVQVNTLIEGWTGYQRTNARLSAVVQQGQVMFRTMEFESNPGVTWSAVIFGTFVGRLGQVYSIVTAAKTDESDPRLQAAVAHVMGSIAKNFNLSPQSLTQMPPRIPGTADFAGAPLLTLTTSQLRRFPTHRLDTESRPLIVTSSGRFFEGNVSDYVAQGTLTRNDALSAYELTYGDGSFDVIPMSCAGAPASVNAAPISRPVPASQSAPGRNCRVETKTVFKQRMMVQCDYRNVCGTVPVNETSVEEGATICD